MFPLALLELGMTWLTQIQQVAMSVSGIIAKFTVNFLCNARHIYYPGGFHQILLILIILIFMFALYRGIWLVYYYMLFVTI